MATAFGVRGDEKTYADDDAIRIFRADRYKSDDKADELWMPERPWRRIRCLG